MKNSKYHNILSDYFVAKGQYFNPINWNKCSNRIIAELPFQILRSFKPQGVNSVLCNPLFLEASIQKGLLNNLLEDFKIAIEKKNLKNIIPVQNSILNGISAIRLRPSMSIFSIVNRLLYDDIDDVTKEFLHLTKQKLNNNGIWLCIQTKFSNVQQIIGIIDINAAKYNYYVLKDNSFIEIHDLETHITKSYHQLNTLSSNFEVVINPTTESIATLDNFGNLIIDSVISNIKLTSQLNCFKWFHNGIIGINIHGLLVYIDIIGNTESTLCDLPILSYSFIKVSEDLKTSIVVSGDRPNIQKIYLIETDNANPILRKIKFEELTVTSACLDKTGSFILLSTLARELVLFNIKTNQKTIVTYRMASDLPVRGKIDNCYLFLKQNKHIAILTTTDGELLIWDTTQDSIKRKGTFKGLKQYLSVQALAILPERHKFVLATNETFETLDIEGEEFLVAKTPVNNCCLANDYWVITLNEQEKKVTWFYENKQVSEYIHNGIQPYSITTFGENGTVVVGCKNGTVIKLSPNITPNVDEAIDLFDGHPIVSVINWGAGRILAVSNNAQIKITDFESNPHVKEISPLDNIREEQMACRLGMNGDIVLCGRSHSGDSLWSVYVIKRVDRREKVFESEEIVSSISSSEDGKFIYAIINGSVSCYTKISSKNWSLFSKRKVQAKHLACCSNDFLAVILEEKGMYWLELWNNTSDMKTITAIDLPFHATCIFALSNLIAIGTEDGKHIIIKIHKQQS
jgi:hypothetical protein